MGLQNPIPFYFFSLIPFFFFNLSLEAPGCLAQGLDVLHKPLGLDAPHCSALESPEEARSVTAGLGSAMVWPRVATRHGHEARPRASPAHMGMASRGGPTPLHLASAFAALLQLKVRCPVQLAVCLLPRLQINFMLDYVTESLLFFFQELAMSWEIISAVVSRSPFP